MVRVWVVVGVVAVALMIFTIVDIALADRRRVRGVPKGVWIVIGFLPILGTILWFAVGRGPLPEAPKRYIAPDDDPAFFSKLADKEDQDERIRRLEQELAELDDDPPAEK